MALTVDQVVFEALCVVVAVVVGARARGARPAGGAVKAAVNGRLRVLAEGGEREARQGGDPARPPRTEQWFRAHRNAVLDHLFGR